MDQAHSIVQFLRSQPLLTLAIGAIVLSVIGGLFPQRMFVGRLMRGTATLGLLAAFGLTVAQVARLNGGIDVALPEVGLPAQTVTGGETRIELARDGHFWVRAEINGTPARFLVDTGATLTAISPATARDAGLAAGKLRQPVIMRTANGAIEARVATIDELKFGSVVARDLDTVIAPGMGETNVLGMNLLSRLASWRVEGQTMILTPHHPQAKGRSVAPAA